MTLDQKKKTKKNGSSRFNKPLEKNIRILPLVSKVRWKQETNF